MSDAALTTLPRLSALPTLPAAQRARILDLLFEPSTALHTLALPLLSPSSATTFAPASPLAHASFPSYAALVAAVGRELAALAESPSTSDTEWLHTILASHPRLGEERVESVLSRMEQGAMEEASKGGEGGGDGGEGREELARLNREYEEKFPGLRYVVFVDGRSRQVIMEDMRRRIERGDVKAERLEAIQVGL